MKKGNRSVKQFVRERDKVCQRCGWGGSKENPLQIHHRKKKSLYPHLAQDPNNMQLVCADCHALINKGLLPS